VNQLLFPMVLDYAASWGDWEVVRELGCNALDADPNFRMHIADCKPDELASICSNLIVEDKGPGIEPHQLLMGVSEKSGSNPIGQFGEGLKLALLVLTRMGLTAHVYSKGLHFWNEKGIELGHEVLVVKWEPRITDRGAKVIIPNWAFPLYDDRFLRPGDPRIIFEDQWGRKILRQESPDIFVKDVWVCKAGKQGYGKPYAFGYSLVDTKMNRDRGVVDSWEASREVARLWASVTDEELLVEFFEAVSQGLAETGCYIYGNLSNKKAFKNAFARVFGSDVVVKTNDEMAREAEYRGARPLSEAELGHGIMELAKELVGTDTEHIQQMEGKDVVLVPDNKLDPDKFDTISLTRRLAKRFGFKGKILAAIIPSRNGEYYRGNIRLNIEQLNDEEGAISTLLHELAHAEYNTADATAAHVTAVANVAARMIMGYARR
jgi:hypothetical protein